MTPPIPKVLRIEPAASCNFSCVHCPTGVGNGVQAVMSDKVFDRALAFARRHAPWRSIVLYHGGEPLLDRKLVARAGALRPLTEKLRMVTNGSLLANYAAGLVAVPLDEVEISFDGTSPSENDAIRRGSKFQAVVDGVKTLIKARSGTDNKPSITVIHTLSVEDLSRDDSSEFLLSALPDLCGGEFTLRREQAFKWVSPDSLAGKREHVCDKVESTITIRATGDIVPCCYDLSSAAVMGSVLDETPEKIWLGSKFESFRSTISGAGWPPPLCRGCRVLYGVRRTAASRKDLGL